ncbi:unnamed protein product [Cercospora beticola]|nr:unnamed protein product [Cercospora beticola]
MSSNTRPFQVKSDSQGNTVDVQIGELPGIVAENLGLATWGAAVVLADVLYRWTEDIKRMSTEVDDLKINDISKHIPVLELGAGTGLAGLTASALWNLPAILTDLSPVVPGIAHNISLNPSLEAYAGTLDWTSPSTLNITSSSPGDDPMTLSCEATKTSILLAADTIYTSAHAQLIPSTTLHWLARTPYARAIFCYPLRSSYIEHARDLWKEMQASGFVCVEEGREQAKELWGEIAPVPYEWCVWGWREFHPEAVAREEAEKVDGEGWLAM